MSKNQSIQEITTLLAKSLRHKIGGIVNKNEIYAQKYAKDADILLKESQKVSLRENWSNYDKSKILAELKRKLIKELEKKDFLDNSKFSLVDKEINKALVFLKLNLNYSRPLIDFCISL